jgi:peptidoglycan-associated lipoprotein
MKIQLTIAVAVLALAACSSTPTQTPAEIKDAGGGAAPVTAPPSGPTTGTIPNVTPNAVETFNPLKEFSVYFELDKYDVSDTYIPVVRGHANYLQKNPAKRASVQGNTDERGSREYNLSLGQKRAEAVKKLLVTMGAKDAQIEAVSFGEEKPKAVGHDETAWAQNRRSDITYAQ